MKYKSTSFYRHFRCSPHTAPTPLLRWPHATLRHPYAAACTPPRCRPHIAPTSCTPLHAPSRPASIARSFYSFLLKFCRFCPLKSLGPLFFETFFWPPHAPPSKTPLLSSASFNKFFVKKPPRITLCKSARANRSVTFFSHLSVHMRMYSTVRARS